MKWSIVDRDTECLWAAAPNRAEAYRMCRDMNFMWNPQIRFKVVRNG